MNITVFGASGKVGRLVVEQLLQAGHKVTVFVHNGKDFDERVKLVRGDVHDASLVAEALQGSDAVISTLGSWHTPTKDILSSAMANVIPAMQAASINRIITVTGSAAWAPGDTITTGNKLAHMVFGLIGKKIISDAETHLKLLAASNLNWTTLRASIMTNGSSPHYTLNDALPSAWETVSRRAVASALVDQLTDVKHYRQAPQIHKV